MIFDRLRYSPGLVLATLIMTVPMAIMGYLLYAEVDERIQRLELKQLGLSYIAQSRPLIRHIPQHRGMAAAFLKGDESFRQQMLIAQRSIDNLFAELAKTDAEIGARLTTGQRVQVLTKTWQNLKSNILTFTPQESFTHQTKLISEIIAHIAHVADTSGLILDPSLDSFYLTAMLVKQMPLLTEEMGLSRAIVAVAAVKGSLSPTSRDQLIKHLARAEVAANRLNGTIDIVYNENPLLKQKLFHQLNLASESVIHFVHLVDEQLLDARQITVSSIEIFGSGTKAIDAVFKSYDLIVEELHQLFVERILAEKQTRLAGLALLIAALILIFFVSIAFYKTLNRFKNSLDMTHDSIFMFSPETLKFFYLNQAAVDLLGYSRAELMQMNPLDIGQDFDEASLQALLTPLYERQQSTVNFETHLRQKNGIVIPVEIRLQYIHPKGEVAHFIVMARNLTEKRESQIRLRETEERNLLLLKSVAEGIYGLDTEGCVTFINPAACQMLGYSEEEAIGQYMHNLIHHSYPDGTHYPAELCMMYRSFTGDESERVDNEVFWHEDGHSFPVEYTSTPIKKDGESFGAVITFHDISERIKNEQALVIAKDQANQANQAKSEFLSSMSHELRTPMNAILGFAQILQYDEDLDESKSESVDEIMKAGKHLLKLINEVLDLAKIESGHIHLSLEPVELCPVIHDCLSLINPLAEQRNIHITHHGLKGITVQADRTRLKQVLLNLLSNAIKYNRDDGSVTIDLQPQAQDRLRIFITDSGFGIPAEHLAEIFSPFNRLDAEGGNIEGTGIGLTITRRIMTLMNGSVGVDSEVGVGSSFWVDLPLQVLSSLDFSQPLPPQSSDCIAGVQDNTAAEATVLYIEDNPANLKLVEELLKRRKQIKLLTAQIPELGIELAQIHQPDLILLDINMFGMDGYQVLKTLKSDDQLKNIPVIAITANALAADIDRGMAAGFADYLTKPLDIPQFFGVLDRSLEIDS